MKRSQINQAIRRASEAFARHQWVLPPNARWDVTDFGLGDFDQCGLTLVNLAEQPEYCEKIMYVSKDQITPAHHHQKKKEDIICRWGTLAIRLISEQPEMRVQINGETRSVSPADPILLEAGWRITLEPGMAHEFWAESPYAIVGEVSTANDDVSDNCFVNEAVGRFSQIIEDEPPFVKLVSD